MEADAKQSLDRGTIVHAALALLDEVGLEGLSARRLADALGVRSPALYWHFKNKREIVDAMAEAMLRREEWPAPDRRSRPERWLAGRARSFRRDLLSHRDGALLHAGTIPGPEELRSIEAQVAALVADGLTPVEAARAVLAISRYTVGWVLEEQAGAERAAAGAGDAIDLPPGTYPYLEEARAVAEQRDPGAEFDHGLVALINGMVSSRRALR